MWLVLVLNYTNTVFPIQLNSVHVNIKSGRERGKVREGAGLKDQQMVDYSLQG